MLKLRFVNKCSPAGKLAPVKLKPNTTPVSELEVTENPYSSAIPPDTPPKFKTSEF